MKQLIVISLVSVLFLACQNQKKKPDNIGRTLQFNVSVQFLSENGDRITSIKASLANTPELRSLGLMDVRSLSPDQGMLFIFDYDDILNFWMANTPLPLDIIFVDKEFNIVRIHHSAQPFSHLQYSSDIPAKYVVEVNAGFCRRNDISEGNAKIFF